MQKKFKVAIVGATRISRQNCPKSFRRKGFKKR